MFPELNSHLSIIRMQNRDQYRMSIRGVSGLALEESKPTLEFSELFSLKSIYVKYKNAVLSHIDCLSAHGRIRQIGMYTSYI